MMEDVVAVAREDEPTGAPKEPTPLVPRRRAPGKLPRPQAAKNGDKRAKAPPAPRKTLAELSNAEFCAFPKDEGEPAPCPLIVIRAGEGGEIFYRVFGFETPGQDVKALLSATAHLGGSLADNYGDVINRLNAVVGAVVGTQGGKP